MIKKLFLFVAFFCGALNASSEPFKTLNSLYPTVQIHPNKWKSELAFEGVVLEATESNNTPYIKIEIGKGSGKFLWVAMLFSVGSGESIKIGNEVKFFGFYDSLEKNDKVSKINKSGFHLLAFCVVNVTTSEAYFMPNGIKQCEKWQNGELPSI